MAGGGWCGWYGREFVEELEAARFRLYALQDGAVRSQALAFCLRAGLFEMLAEGPLTAGRIRDRAGISGRVLPALVAFLASQGLVERRAGDEFELTQAARVFLLRSSPRYIGGRGLLFAGFHEAIGHLGESLASGRPWTASGQHDMFGAFGAEEQRWFADGMFANAVHGGEALVRQVDFSGYRRLLDVGGGSGGYTIAILGKCPGLRATIFDLPGVRALVEERAAEAGLAGRIEFVAGSFFADELPGGHDVALLASILHDWDDGDCLRILGRCHRALAAGGLLVVTEPMLREDHTGPDHPSVSGLTMVVLGGENRTPSQVCGLLEAAGFDGCWCSEVGPQTSVVTARKS